MKTSPLRLCLSWTTCWILLSWCGTGTASFYTSPLSCLPLGCGIGEISCIIPTNFSSSEEAGYSKSRPRLSATSGSAITMQIYLLGRNFPAKASHRRQTEIRRPRSRWLPQLRRTTQIWPQRIGLRSQNLGCEYERKYRFNSERTIAFQKIRCNSPPWTFRGCL